MIDLSALAITSPISYLIAVALPAFDAVIPILPSETAIITLGVATAGSTDPRIGVLVLLAALGAFLGDNLTYQIGRWLGPAIDRRVFAGEKGAKRRAWASNALEQYGWRIIIACRFVPGGRTAVTLICGLIGYRRRTFIAATAVAGVIWACYAFFIGRLGGHAFQGRPWAGLLLALGIALAVSALIELARRLRIWPRLVARYRRVTGRPARPASGAESGPESDGESMNAEPDEGDRGQADVRPSDPDRPEVPSR
jgi:membrane protein DedA with SNARE-associated domain